MGVGMSQKRSIFEEVSSDQKAEVAKPQPGAIDRANKGARQAVRLWLIVLFALVAVMILVGGLTRLTDSGLSITEWKPVTGAMPPANEQAWNEAFEKYQSIPEFQLQNNRMTLEEFKSIYWWEWGHRQLGRVIGLVWAVGFVAFWAMGRIPTGWRNRLFTIGVLIGVQGAIGWWMVSSGLTGTMLDVASYRLAIHLGLAFIILGLLAWYILAMSRREADLLQARRGREAKLLAMSTELLGVAFLQILLGALVAGIDAGRGYTDWPLMAGEFFPSGSLDMVPVWRNFFEDDGMVQFMHRIVGYVLILFALIVWQRSRSSGNKITKRAFDFVAATLIIQMVLGIITVMNSAPLHLASMHQFWAIVCWVVLIHARFQSQYPKTQSLRGGL